MIFLRCVLFSEDFDFLSAISLSDFTVASGVLNDEHFRNKFSVSIRAPLNLDIKSFKAFKSGRTSTGVGYLTYLKSFGPLNLTASANKFIGFRAELIVINANK